MTPTAAAAALTYRRTEIQSRSPIELVIMLYEGASRAMSAARTAIEQGNGQAKREAVSRALAIVAELQNVLNMESGGEIATSLDALYSFVNGRLIDANQQNNVTAIDDAVRVLTPLHEAWVQLANSPSLGESR